MKKAFFIFLCLTGASQLSAQTAYEFQIDDPRSIKFILLKDIEGDLSIYPTETDLIEINISLYKDSKFYNKSAIPSSIKFVQEEDHLVLEGISNDSNRKYKISLPDHLPLKFQVKNNRDNLEISNNNQPLEIQAQGMDIQLLDNSGPLNITTTHGDLTISWKDARPKEDSHITTVSGNIEMEVDESSSFKLFIDPYRGSVENVWDLQLKRSSKYQNRKTYDAIYNKGGSTLFLETSVGDIILNDNN